MYSNDLVQVEYANVKRKRKKNLCSKERTLTRIQTTDTKKDKKKKKRKRLS